MRQETVTPSKQVSLIRYLGLGRVVGAHTTHHAACDPWQEAFREIAKARSERRAPLASAFTGLTKAAGERARCPRCTELL